MCSTSAMIVADEEERTYLLFKLAYKFASDGLKCLIISKTISRGSIGKIINERGFFSPDVLELIQFRHFSTATSLIDWCHGFLIGQTMPHAIFLNGFEDFCDASEFSAYYLCACLIDTTEYLTISLLDRNVHNFQLMIAFNSFTHDSRPAFFDLFHNILSAGEVVEEFHLTIH